MHLWKRAVPIALCLLVSALTRATMAQGGHYDPPPNATDQGSELTGSTTTTFSIILDIGIDTKPKNTGLTQAKYTMRCAREDDHTVAGPFDGWATPNAGHVIKKTPLSDVKVGDHIICSTHWEHDAVAGFNGGEPWKIDTRDESKIPAPRNGPPIGGDGQPALQRSGLRYEVSNFVPRAGHPWSVKAIPGDLRDPIQQLAFDHAIIFWYLPDDSHYDIPVPAEEVVKGDDGSLALNMSANTLRLVRPGDHLEVEFWRVPEEGEPIGTRSEILTQPFK